MGNMEIQIKTLTPIWTGGIQTGQMERVHETGIIGSLRWWYEAIVRGLGYTVCDPVGRGNENEPDSKCRFDPDKDGPSIPEQAEKKLCPACYLFGATGWRRRFRIRISGEVNPAWGPSSPSHDARSLNVRPPNRSRGWFLPPGYVGNLSLQFVGEDKALQQIARLFLFLEEFGAIGAKPQLGYGFFKIDNRESLVSNVADFPPILYAGQHPNLPDIRAFHFFSYEFQPSGKAWWSYISGLERLLGKGDTSRVLSGLLKLNMVPVTPALKDEWRYGSQERLTDEKIVFGTTHYDRIRSKVAASWAYREDHFWKVRGWVWLPEEIHKRTGDFIKKRLSDTTIWNKTLKAHSGTFRMILGNEALSNREEKQ